MKKILIAASFLAACESGPPEHGGMTSIGITEMSARLGCLYGNTRVENMQRGFSRTSWTAICTSPPKAIDCVNKNGNVTCHSK